MVGKCAFCLLQSSDSVSSSNIIIDAIQVISEALMEKQRSDKIKEAEITLALNDAKKTVEDLKILNKQLSEEKETLCCSLSEMQKRADSYKEKFLKVQENLIESHKRNQKLNRCSNQVHTNAFPFVVSPANQSKTMPIILAPDTCAAEHLNDNNAFLEPLPIVSKQEKNKNDVKTKCSDTSAQLPSMASYRDSFDLDETHVDVDQKVYSNLDEEECSFSIPPSPKCERIKINMQEDKTSQNMLDECTNGSKSPSLLPSSRKLRMSPLKRPFLKNLHIKHKAEDGNVLEDTHIDFDGHNDSLDVILKKRSLSSVHFEDDSEFERVMLQADLDTSIDQLFNKTDGCLPSLTSMSDSEANEDEANDKHQDLPSYKMMTDAINLKAPVKMTSSRESFDAVPKKADDFKHRTVVRKRSDRDKLEWKACPQCCEYYSDLPPQELDAVMRNVCRHRHKHLPPSTPQHFWEIDIPSTAECKRRGYLKEEEDLLKGDEDGLRESLHRRRRKRPFQAHFPTKSIN